MGSFSFFGTSASLHAGGHTEGGGNGSQYGDDYVDNLTPNVLVFHFLSYELLVMSYFFTTEYTEFH